ncbi:MAG: hypothetical protein ACLSGB_15875 [Dorea sp.]
MLKKWEALPEFMKNDEVRAYYNSLQKKKISMFFEESNGFRRWSAFINYIGNTLWQSLQL